MIYPDEEKIVYNYDLGGNLCKVFGKKSYLYTYIDTIKYDLFGQRSYIRYGNGAETKYKYSSNRQRLSNLTVNVACRTGLGSDSDWWGMFTYKNKSFAQAIANKTGAIVNAYAVRTNYKFTLGSWSERRYNFPNPKPFIKSVDGAAFTPYGAAHPVTNGSTPLGVYSGMLNFRPQK